MKTQIIVRMDEMFKEGIKLNAEKLELTSSEFLRLLFICYKNNDSDEQSNLSRRVEEKLSRFKSKVKKEFRENINNKEAV